MDDSLFLLVQRSDLSWTAFMDDPNGGKPICIGPGHRIAVREATEARWEKEHGHSIPSEYSFSEIPYVETVGLRS